MDSVKQEAKKDTVDVQCPIMALALALILSLGSSCGVCSRGPNSNRTSTLSSPPLHRWRAQGFLGMTSALLASSAPWEQAFHFRALLGSTLLSVA